MSLILSGTDGLSDVDGSAATPAIRGTDANTGIFFPAADTIAFAEGGTEAMRLDASGNLLVGRTSPRDSEIFSVSANRANFISEFASTSATPANIILALYPNGSPNNTASHFLRGADSTATRFELRSNGGLANYSANNVNLSDRREKTNFTPATSYLDKICAIPVQTFNYIDQNLEEDGGLTLGVVAQDVQAVAPEMVMESNWGTEEEPKIRLSIYQTDLQYALMKCIQEQQAIIESLKARLDAANL
jgi:hypothetical protein